MIKLIDQMMDDKSGIKSIISPSLFDGRRIEDPGRVKQIFFHILLDICVHGMRKTE